MILFAHIPKCYTLHYVDISPGLKIYNYRRAFIQEHLHILRIFHTLVISRYIFQHWSQK